MGAASGYPARPLAHVLGLDSLGRVGKMPVGDLGGGAGGAGASTFTIDPHLPPYNCKGDAVCVTGYVTGGNTLTSRWYEFSGKDVSPPGSIPGAPGVKTLWLMDDDIPRIITAIGGPNGKSAIFTPAAANSQEGNGQQYWDPALNGGAGGMNIYYVEDQPDLFLLGTDDTDGLRLAQEHAATLFAGITGTGKPQSIPAIGAGLVSDKLQMPLSFYRGGIPMGGTVQLRAGRGYIVRNDKADYDLGVTSALRHPRRTALIGGRGMFGSTLYLKPGSWGDVWAPEGSESTGGYYCDFITVEGITAYPFASYWNSNRGTGSGKARYGFKLRVAFDGYAKADPYCRMSRLQTWDSWEAGFKFQGRGELFAFDLNAAQGKELGFDVDGLADSRFLHLVAAGCGHAGLKTMGGGPLHYSESKFFYNGQGGGDDPTKCCNVWSTTDNEYTGASTFNQIETQESRGSAWVIEAPRGKYNNCTAYDPGRETMGGGTLPPVIAGVHLRGKFCFQNEFRVFDIRATLTQFGSAPGENTANMGDAVTVDGYNLADGSGGPQGNYGEFSVAPATTIPKWNGAAFAESPVRAGAELKSGKQLLGGGGSSNGRNVGLQVRSGATIDAAT